jgi:hypothetical protein
MRYISKINRGGKKERKAQLMLRRQQIKRDISDVLQRTGSEARCAKYSYVFSDLNL